MNMHRYFLLSFVLTLALAACSKPSAPPEAQAPVYTPAGETAVPVVATQPPPASPTPAPPTATFTPVVIVVTPTAQPTMPPTATPQPTPTWVAVQTATPLPTATAAVASNPYELGPPDMIDSMDIPGEHWYVWGAAPKVQPLIEPGRLGLMVTKTGTITHWIRSTYPPLEDAYVQAVFKTGKECHQKDRYGLLVRAPSEYEGIFFLVSCDGMFKIFRWNGGLKVLQEWTRSPAIHTGPRQINRVGVWMEGATLSLYVNNAKVAEVHDDLFTKGMFGLLVGAERTHNFVVYVDEVAYWELPKAAHK